MERTQYQSTRMTAIQTEKIPLHVEISSLAKNAARPIFSIRFSIEIFQKITSPGWDTIFQKSCSMDEADTENQWQTTKATICKIPLNTPMTFLSTRRTRSFNYLSVPTNRAAFPG